MTAFPATYTRHRQWLQSSACMLCFDDDLGNLIAASATAESMLGLSLNEAFGQSAQALAAVPVIAALLETLDGILPESAEVLHHDLQARGQHWRTTLWRDQDYVMLELEPCTKAEEAPLLRRFSAWVNTLSAVENQEALLARLVDAVREFSGYERVMIYAFDQDWHSTIIAENRDASLPAYLHRSFPATDVPDEVRQRFQDNGMRNIPDVNAEPIPLLCADAALGSRSLNLSPGTLQAAPDYHLARLRRMGVSSALSFAVNGTERLWGIVSCHAREQHPLSPMVRDVLHNLVQVGAQRLAFLDMRAKLRYARKVLESRSLLTDKPGQTASAEQLVEIHGEQWLELLDATGVVLAYERSLSRVGETPRESALFDIQRRLTAWHHDSVPWVSEQLSSSDLAEVGNLDDQAGLLAIPLPSVSPPAWLLFFRLPQDHGYDWVGPRQMSERMAESLANGFRSEPWLDQQVQAAVDIAEDLAVAISVNQIARLNARLKESSEHYAEMARTDALTQVWNRFFMEQAIEKALASASTKQPVSLLLFDVDHFKAFNDRFGHESGDKVLKLVAAEVKGLLRSTDLLGRWGGEEFIVLARNSSQEEGRVLAERLRAAVAALDTGGLGQITISLGVVNCVTRWSRKSLVRRADQAMYEAKNNGRNQVCIAEH